MVKKKINPLIWVIPFMFLLVVMPFVVADLGDDLDNGLVSVWQFSESSGTTTANSVNTTYNGDLYNDVTFVAGINGNAVNISGGDNFVNISNTLTEISGTDPFTFNLWTKTFTAGTWLPFSSHVLITSEGSSFGTDATSGGSWSFYTGTSTHNFSPYPTDLNNGSWHMITFVQNATRTCVYFNGIVHVCDGVGNAITPTGLFFGKQVGFTGAERQVLDEFYIWDRALNETEISQLAVGDSNSFYEATDITSPIVTINSPTATTYNNLITEINFTATDETSLDICWYSVDGGVTNITTNCNELVTSLTTEDNNSYTWVVGANDTSGNEGSDSVTFDIDLPYVSITSPTATTYIVFVTDLEYVYKDSPQACWYSLDGGETNVTIVCGENVTSLNSTEGSNTWNIWANNSIGDIFGDSITFVVDLPEPPNPLESNVIYTSMRGAGAGLGIFINFMGEALPPLILGLAFVGIIVLIGYGIASVFKMNLVKSIRGK